MNISIKNLIVVEIITPLKISTEVDNRTLCQFEELDLVLLTLEKGRRSQMEIARIERKLRIVGLPPERLPRAFATGTGRVNELARLLPTPATERTALRRKKVAKEHKRNLALLSQG